MNEVTKRSTRDIWRTKRFNKRVELFASYMNGIALVVMALGVFCFVLDAAPDAETPSARFILGIVGLSVGFHIVAQSAYFALKPEE